MSPPDGPRVAGINEAVVVAAARVPDESRDELTRYAARTLLPHFRFHAEGLVSETILNVLRRTTFAAAALVALGCEAETARRAPESSTLSRTGAAASATDSVAPPSSVPGAPVVSDRDLVVAEADAGATLTIGAIEGRPHEVFGRIADVAVGPSGDVFILDNLNLDVRWFSADGTFRGSAGRAGGGPGEFRSPMSISVRPDGLVEVLDMAYRRLTRFAPSPDNGLLLRSELTIPVFGMDFCSMNGNYFVLANDSVGNVNVVDSMGAVIRRFAEPVGRVPPDLERHRRILQEGFTRGAVLCAEELDIVVVLSSSLGLVRAFTSEGSPLWSLSLAGFSPQRPVPGTRGDGFRYELDPETGLGSTATFLGRVGRAEAAVTVEHWNRHGRVGVEWRWLDLASGTETGVIQSSGLVLAGQAAGVTVAFQGEPYPRVVIRRGVHSAESMRQEEP